MNAKPQLLLKSAHLENFVLHKDTFVEFERPIVLLTGGNSSGKTLFLEGLLLALGIKSQRIRDGRINAIIGGNGKSARGSVQINNPKISGRRIIWFDNDQLDELIEADVFTVGYEISARDTNLNYFVINDEKKHTITLTLLSQLLDRINLDTRNKLVFTESGDVSEIVSSSPRKRFETLLKITGMQDRFTQVSELSSKTAEFTPVLNRLEEENKRRGNELNELKLVLEEIKAKERLEERKKYLQGALIWCEVLEIKERISKIKDRQAELKYQERELKADLETEQVELEKIDAELLNLNSLRTREEQSQYDIVRKENDLKHEIERIQREISDAENEIAKFSEELDKLDLFTDEDFWNAQENQKKLSAEYDNADLEFRKWQTELNQLTKTAQILRSGDSETDFADETDQKIFSALKLTAILRSHDIKFWGPLGAEIEIIDETLIPFLGDLFFEYWVYEDDKAKLIELLEEITNLKTSDFSFRFININNSSQYTDLGKYFKCQDNALFDALTREINFKVDDCDKIEQIVGKLPDSKTIFFRNFKLSAQDRKIQIHDEKEVEIYEKFKAHKTRSIEELENALEALQKLNKLKPESERLSDEVKRMQAEYMEASAYLHKINETNKTRETLTKAVAKALETKEKKEKELEVKMFERQKLQEKLDQLTSLENLTENIKEMNADRDKINNRIGSIQNKLVSLRNELARLQGNLEREEKQRSEKSSAAMTYLPEVPSDLTPSDESEVRRQIAEIDFRLRKMDNLTATYEQYERKKSEFESHARKLKRTKNAFHELRERLEHERSLWQDQLQDYVDLINKHMRESLHERFSQIRVELTEPENVDKCGLNIEAKHRQAFIDSATRIRGLSGGERGIVTEAFIFATHLLTYSPLHVIDEFTQRMDLSTKELAFNIAAQTAIKAQQLRKTLNAESEFSEYAYDPLFILACPDTTGLDFMQNDLFSHLVCLRLADGNSNVLGK